MVHRLEAMLLVPFELGQTLRPDSGDSFKPTPRGLCAELSVKVANIGNFCLRSPPPSQRASSAEGSSNWRDLTFLAVVVFQKNYTP
jgi:hypothetical protein